MLSLLDGRWASALSSCGPCALFAVPLCPAPHLELAFRRERDLPEPVISYGPFRVALDGKNREWLPF